MRNRLLLFGMEEAISSTHSTGINIEWMSFLHSIIRQKDHQSRWWSFCCWDCVALLSFLHYCPSIWDIAGARSLWQCRWASECTRCCDTRDPVRCRVRSVPSREVDIYRRELAAILEHLMVAVVDKCSCRQFRSSRQGCAILEHELVAVVGKCGCR